MTTSKVAREIEQLKQYGLEASKAAEYVEGLVKAQPLPAGTTVQTLHDCVRVETRLAFAVDVTVYFNVRVERKPELMTDEEVIFVGKVECEVSTSGTSRDLMLALAYANLQRQMCDLSLAVMAQLSDRKVFRSEAKKL